MAEYAKGQHIRGEQRREMAKWLADRYEDGDSIRELADATGRSFTFIRDVLVESGVQLRPRGGTAGEPRPCLTDETARAQAAGAASGRQRWAAEAAAVREMLAKELPERYEAGETIRELAASTGRSFGLVHRVLVESGVRLRAQGGARPVRSRRG